MRARRSQQRAAAARAERVGKWHTLARMRRDLDQLERSRALWNRSTLDLRSDEILAQILDRGEMTAWRELYRMAREDSELRGRIARLVQRIPLPLPHFRLAALASLGEPVDVGATTPPYGEDGV